MCPLVHQARDMSLETCNKIPSRSHFSSGKQELTKLLGPWQDLAQVLSLRCITSDRLPLSSSLDLPTIIWGDELGCLSAH